MFWVRRNLAMIVIARGGYDNVEKARKLIENNIAAAPDSTVDKRLMAALNSAIRA